MLGTININFSNNFRTQNTCFQNMDWKFCLQLSRVVWKWRNGQL